MAFCYLFFILFFVGSWMNTPQNTINCPPGLEYLTMIDHLLVAQKVELMEGINFLVQF